MESIGPGLDETGLNFKDNGRCFLDIQVVFQDFFYCVIQVRVIEDNVLVGAGKHERFIINEEKFLKNLGIK